MHPHWWMHSARTRVQHLRTGLSAVARIVAAGFVIARAGAGAVLATVPVDRILAVSGSLAVVVAAVEGVLPVEAVGVVS